MSRPTEDELVSGLECALQYVVLAYRDCAQRKEPRLAKIARADLDRLIGLIDRAKQDDSHE